MMCFSPVLLRQPPAESNGGLYAYTAKVDAYLAQAGWHEEGDALRVWAETTVNGGDQPGRRAVSMLPGCAHVATKHTVDMLMLRAQTACYPWATIQLHRPPPTETATLPSFQTPGSGKRCR